eukprot:TRINITY_DN374_c0_g1_i1.p1 TRINITY_DN374_c0_g1~~TRINITY_DN374_c0_g1_i1.p1  ORF type:complete len:1052 (+),score=324.24 TRINITY_DN374_c0_g1_i1:114-3269(+)
MGPPSGRPSATIALLLLPAVAAQKIGLLWPDHCTGERAEACHLMTKSAEVAVKDFVNKHHTKWTPVLVHAPDAHTPDPAHDSFEALCDMLVKTGISGIVGPITSLEAEVVAKLAGWHQVPMVSPAADSALLAERADFPYFRRTIPGSDAQGDAAAEYARKMNWTEASILYEKGSLYAASLMHSAADSFSHLGGRISHVEALHAGLEPSAYTETMRHLREQYIQVVMLFGSATFVASILEAAIDPEHPPPLFGSGRVWIAGEGIADPLAGLAHLWDGNEDWGCVHHGEHVTTYCECSRCQAHLTRARGLLSVGVGIDVWAEPVKLLAEGLGFKDSERAHLSILERSTYDAVTMLLNALDETGAWAHTYHSAHCTYPDPKPWAWGPYVLKYLDEHSFDGAMGHLDMSEIDKRFPYDLVNLQRDPHSDSSHWYTTGHFLPKSLWPEEHGVTPSAPSSGHDRRRARRMAGTPAASPSEGGGELLDADLLKVTLQDGTLLAQQWCDDCKHFDWPGHGAAPNSRSKLQGLHLHVLGVEDPPYLYVNHSKPVSECEISPAPETGCYWGALWDLITDFKHKFHFTFDMHTVHGQLNTALDMLAKPHSEYDMLLGNIAISEERQLRMDFTQPLFETEAVVVVRMPVPADPSMFRFLEPFTWAMWLTVIGIIVVGAAVFYWLENGVNDGIADGRAGCEDALFWSYLAFLFTAPFAPATRGGRLMSLGIFFIALVALSAYTAELTVYLLRVDKKYQFGDFNAFLPGGGESGKRVLVTEDSLEHKWMCSVCNCCDDPVSSPRALGFLPATDTQEEEDAHHRIVHELLDPCEASEVDCPLGGVFEKHLAEFIIGTNCELTIHPTAGNGINGQGPVPTLDRFGLGIALKKYSPYTNIFSEEILYLKEHHLVETMQKLWMTGTCPGVDASSPPKTTSVDQFAGVYVIFCGVMAVTFVYKVIFVVWAKQTGSAEDVDGDGRADDVIGAEKRRMSGGGIAEEDLVLARVMRFLEEKRDEAGLDPLKSPTAKKMMQDCQSEGGSDEAGTTPRCKDTVQQLPGQPGGTDA